MATSRARPTTRRRTQSSRRSARPFRSMRSWARNPVTSRERAIARDSSGSSIRSTAPRTSPMVIPTSPYPWHSPTEPRSRTRSFSIRCVTSSTPRSAARGRSRTAHRFARRAAWRSKTRSSARCFRRDKAPRWPRISRSSTGSLCAARGSAAPMRRPSISPTSPRDASTPSG